MAKDKKEPTIIESQVTNDYDRIFGVGKIGTLKKKLLIALNASFGVVTTACTKAGCCRETYRIYYNNDPKFKEAVDELRAVADDFAETQLFQNIKDGDIATCIYYAKTRLKHRGYGPDRESAGENKVWEAPPPPNITFTIHNPTPPAQ